MTPGAQVADHIVHVELQLAEKLTTSFKPSSVYYGLVLHVRRSEDNGTREIATYHPFLAEDATPIPMPGVVRDQSRVAHQRGDRTFLDKRLVRSTPFEINLRELEDALQDKLQRVLLLLRPTGEKIQRTQGLRLVFDHPAPQDVECSGKGPPLFALYCDDEFKDDEFTLKTPYNGNIDSFVRAIEDAANAHVDNRLAVRPAHSGVGAGSAVAADVPPNGRSHSTSVAEPAQDEAGEGAAAASAAPERKPQPGQSTAHGLATPSMARAGGQGAARPPASNGNGQSGRNIRDVWYARPGPWQMLSAILFLLMAAIAYSFYQHSTTHRQYEANLKELQRKLTDVEGQRDKKDVELREKEANFNKEIERQKEAAKQAAEKALEKALADERETVAVAHEKALSEAKKSAADEAANAERKTAQEAAVKLTQQVNQASRNLTAANATAADLQAKLDVTGRDLAEARRRLDFYEARDRSNPGDRSAERRVAPPDRDIRPVDNFRPTLTRQQASMLSDMLNAASRSDLQAYDDLRRKIASDVPYQARNPARASLDQIEKSVLDAYQRRDRQALAVAQDRLIRFRADDPDYWKSHEQMALVYAGLNQSERAVQHAQQALLHKPDSGDALLAWAIAATQSGKFSDADGAFCALRHVTQSTLVAKFLENLGRSDDTFVNTARVNGRARDAIRSCDRTTQRNRFR